MHPTPSTSASPAPKRFLPTVRRTDGSSPTKRPKFATSSPGSDTSAFSSYSVPTPDPQLHAGISASSTRLLNVWSTLEGKYVRRLDEDDIIDLRSGALVRDRGVLSGKAGTWDIGCFTDAVEGEDESVGLEEVDEDDVDDEFGVWESEADHQVDPIRESDPEDAEDLRAFLAAEEAGKTGLDAEEDLTEDEAPSDGDAHAYTDGDGSVIEVEAESPIALSDAESEDELAGYDVTVGEGALLWEVGSELYDDCSEPIAAERTPRPDPTPARRNQTPAQLRTPPLSCSSAIPLDAPSSSFRRPSLNLLRRSPTKPEPPTPSMSAKKKGKQKEEPPSQETHSEMHGHGEYSSRGKGKEKEMSITPTKKLKAEVLLPSPRRASTMVRDNTMAAEAEQPLRGRTISTSKRAGKLPVTRRASNPQPNAPSPSKPARRASSSHALRPDLDKRAPEPAEKTPASGANRGSEMRPPASPRKRKRVVSEAVDGIDDGVIETPISEVSGGEEDIASAPSAHRRQASASTSRNVRAETPSARDASTQQEHVPQAHPLAPPSFWPSYPLPAAAASFAMPYLSRYPHQPIAPPSQAPSALDAQLAFAQAMQNLNYLTFGAPHASSSHPAPPNPPPLYPRPHTPSSHPHSPSSTTSWPYSSPYLSPQARSHAPPHQRAYAPWLYPQYPYPCPSSSSPFTPGSGAGPPPSSSPEPRSSSTSPLAGKGQGKRVSFSDEEVDDTVRDDIEERAKNMSTLPIARARRDSQVHGPSTNTSSGRKTPSSLKREETGPGPTTRKKR